MQLEMLQEENDNVLNKVPYFSSCSSYPVMSLVKFFNMRLFLHLILVYSSDLRKRDVRKQRPELGSLRNR